MATTAPILDEETAVRLRVAIARLSRRLRPTAAGAEAGLTPTKSAVLLRIVRGDQLRLSQLAEAEGLNPTMLSRVIAGLVDAGLVQRVSDAGDRRAARVKATPAGHRLAERMRRERTAALNRALEGLTDSDQHLIETALPALEALAAELQDGRS